MEEDDEMVMVRYLNSFPVGYRFCPTDNELVVHYLMNKVLNKPLPPNKIRVINLYTNGPQELSAMYGSQHEAKMYFFTSRDRKYPNGNRPNRAAGNGYWKATGVDIVIGAKENPIGYRKALVYYQGKPKVSTKTNWIMHEYRLDQKTPQRPARRHKSLQNINAPPPNMKLDDWVLCKVYLKDTKKQNKNQTTPKFFSARCGPSVPLQNNYNNVASTSAIVPQPQFTLPVEPNYNIMGSISNAPMIAADVYGFSTNSSVPHPQFIVPNNTMGSTSSPPPVMQLQTTNYSSSHIQQDQSFYLDGFPSEFLEGDGNSFLTMFGEDPFLPFGDDITGPNNIG